MKQAALFIGILFMASDAYAQYATGDNTSFTEYATVLKTADRATRDFTNLPSSWSLKKYAPVPGNQGQYGTCVAWSSAYAARTISYAAQRKEFNTDSIHQYTFSPAYLFYKIKNAGDVDCSRGSSVTRAMALMNKTGIMLKKEGFDDCAGIVSLSAEEEKAGPYKIKDYLSLNGTFGTITKNDVLKMKKSLSENKPVVISLKCYVSFDKVSSAGLWTPAANDIFKGGHAMCIVGYDDGVAGGAFEIMNSWGIGWGNKGFCWITYEQMINYGIYAVEMMDHEYAPDLVNRGIVPIISGDITFIQLDESTMPVIRKKINTGSIIVEEDKKADYSLYKLTQNYTGGTAFKMKFSTNAPSYIYVFAEDDQAVISRLFPYNHTISPAINSTNATYYFPSETKHARLSNTPGKENFCVLYSKSEIDFEGLINYIKTTKTPIFKAVKDKLQNRLLDLGKVTFKDHAISFKAPAEESSVLCFFIEMDHY